jgi:tetratricopeptide (TPR) repeat protein
LDAEDASVDDAMKGIGRRSTDSYILPFASFELGNETIKNIRLRVGRSDFTGADMLLGADFFLSHRVFVAQSQHRLYFTYNGGPVFRLDDDGVWSKPFASTAVPSDPRAARTVATSAAAAQDVSVLRRHAAAAAARRDFNGAIRDLDQAIAVEPDNPDLYLDRARWKLSSSAGADGMGDLDKALKLKPDYAEALVARGHLRLAAGKVEQADDDFAAAFKAGLEQPDLELQIAEAYSKTRHFDRAVARYDAWIAQNPQSFDFDKALNGRCWARALWGRELDKALVDCDQALRRGSRLAGVYDSRGMVHLRRGEFALAVTDYTAALKLQPKAAASLYGRGLARQKAGDTAGGEVDLRAATAIEPKIAEWMAGYGITASTVVVANS